MESASHRLEVIAEVRAFLVAHFFHRGFATLLVGTRVVQAAELAGMQVRATGAATLGATEGQRQRRE